MRRGRVVGNGAAGFPQQQENLDGPSNTASKPKLSVMLELEPWAAFLWVLLGVFSCLIQSCSCHLQQISAQMDLYRYPTQGCWALIRSDGGALWEIVGGSVFVPQAVSALASGDIAA